MTKTKRSPVDELCDLLRECGAVVTIDFRRYARAAQTWPDCLPPMFPEANVLVERWGKCAQWDTWVARHPSQWPVPTVEVGQTWEQKSALIPTWDASERAVYPYRNVKHTVVRIDGERFLSSRGYHVPWSEIPGPHWRLINP